jgi:glycosyltransferase involved in cell wall biosynthesis
MESGGKKKILYCITKSNWGGAQRYVYDLATNLPRDRYDVAVVLGGSGKLKEKLERTGVRTISVRALQRDIGISKDISSFFELIKIFRAEKPDIIHLNSSKMGGIGGLAGRIARIKKIIFTAHGWAYNEERNFFQKFAIAILHFTTVAFSHLTIAVSEKAKDQFKSAGLMKKKMVVIHNGIEEIKFVEKEKARQEFADIGLPQTEKVKEKIKSEPFWIGTISELHKNKGLSYAIEALGKLIKNENINASHRNIIFIIMGDGEDRKNLEEIIKKIILKIVSF